nr:RNA methyltransferase [Actinomycetota bacterium]
RLGRRAGRLEQGRFVVEGPQAVREALAGPGLVELFAVRDRHPQLEHAARGRAVPITYVTEAVLGAMADTVTPQGVLGVAALLAIPADRALAGNPRLVAVLDAVADPGNAGTVLRTADAAGADAVLFTDGSVDPHNGKCVRASAGSLFHLPVSCGTSLSEALVEVRRCGLQVLATSAAGDVDLDDLVDEGALSEPTAWLFGPEAQGLSDVALAEADRRVRVPLYGRAESLNLAAAAAVCLYASARALRAGQRGARP